MSTIYLPKNWENYIETFDIIIIENKLPPSILQKLIEENIEGEVEKQEIEPFGYKLQLCTKKIGLFQGLWSSNPDYMTFVNVNKNHIKYLLKFEKINNKIQKIIELA